MHRQIRHLSAAPRAHLFTIRRFSRSFVTSQTFNNDTRKSSTDSFGSFGGGPAPPRLPKEEQEIFEELQRRSTGAFSTPRSPPQVAQSPDSVELEASVTGTAAGNNTDSATVASKKEFDRIIEARGKGEELHPNVRFGATPEFEGEVNPKTGEVGGPKNEPLRWGPAGEWSYNGRTTDF